MGYSNQYSTINALWQKTLCSVLPPGRFRSCGGGGAGVSIPVINISV